MTKDSADIVARLERIAGNRGTARARAPRGRDLLLRLADQPPCRREEGARFMHTVL